MWKYIGDGKGEFIPGVPQRDLTDEEAKTLGVDGGSNIYEHVKKAGAKAEPKTEKEGD